MRGGVTFSPLHKLTGGRVDQLATLTHYTHDTRLLHRLKLLNQPLPLPLIKPCSPVGTYIIERRRVVHQFRFESLN